MRMLELRGHTPQGQSEKKILEKTDELVNEDVDERLPGRWSGSPWINEVR
jgi:hypothetical protein